MKIPFPWHFEVCNMSFEILVSWSKGFYRYFDCVWIIRKISHISSASNMYMVRSHIHLIILNFLISLLLTLFLEHSLIFFEVFTEHILATEFGITSKMVDSGARLHTIFLENPIYLLFFAPQNIPIVTISLFPFPIIETFVNTISESSPKFNIASIY